MPPRAHLVFQRHAGLLLVKRPELNWRQLQDEYDDYAASLGPWTADEIAEYFPLDYGDDDRQWPFSRQAIADFVSAPEELVLKAD